MTRLLAALPVSVAMLLLLAPVALADPQEPLSGEGTYGETTDKIVTNFFFVVIAFFPLLVLVLSLIQWRLEKRKENRKAAAKRLHTDETWQSGW